MDNYQIAKEFTALCRKFHNSAKVEYSGNGGMFTVSAKTSKVLRSVCFDLALGISRTRKVYFSPASISKGWAMTIMEVK